MLSSPIPTPYKGLLTHDGQQAPAIKQKATLDPPALQAAITPRQVSAQAEDAGSNSLTAIPVSRLCMVLGASIPPCYTSNSSGHLHFAEDDKGCPQNSSKPLYLLYFFVKASVSL